MFWTLPIYSSSIVAVLHGVPEESASLFNIEKSDPPSWSVSSNVVVKSAVIVPSVMIVDILISYSNNSKNSHTFLMKMIFKYQINDILISSI